MKRREPIIAATVLALASLSSLAHAAGTEGWPTYEGAWFDVKYPKGFKVVPRQKSSTYEGRYDAVSFVSPDGNAEFYVFSPQWSGTPAWIALAKGERIVSRSTQSSATRKVDFVEVKGPGAKYYRAWADTQSKVSNTRHTFGFKYSSKAAYNQYRARYLLFKASLNQYAD